MSEEHRTQGDTVKREVGRLISIPPEGFELESISGLWHIRW
jgi:hypothetical protein